MAAINFCLVRYGSATEYGPDIPLAAFDLVVKYNIIHYPRCYHAGYWRWHTADCRLQLWTFGLQACKGNFLAAKIATLVAVVCFPAVSASAYGNVRRTGARYTEFFVKSFCIFTLLYFFNRFRIVSAIFFQSIGKPVASGVISFSRQIIFLIPATLILVSREIKQN